MPRARRVEVREGENVFKLVDSRGKELGRVRGLYEISEKKLRIIPISVKALKVLEVG